MLRFRLIAVFVVVLCLSPAASAVGQARPEARSALTQPALSPDGRTIAFVANGAIWEVPASGGVAHILVADGATASRPLYSPSGTRLAFMSDKTGNGDIYVLDLASGTLTRLTYVNSPDKLSAWSSDGRWIYFSSARDNIGGMQAVYRVRVSGGTPMPVALEPYRNEAMAAPSPGGETIALVGQGWGARQWWRDGHAHIDEGAIWLLKNDGSHRYTRLTPDDARAHWPMWAADGQSIYYMSDRGGTENIWRVTRDGELTAVTHFTDGRCLRPTISADGQTIVFQRNFGIWMLDTESGQAHPVSIMLRGAVNGPGVTHKVIEDDYSEMALSPDGQKLALIAHGEVFAAPAREDGPAKRVTHTAAAEFGVAWGPESRRIAYSSARDDAIHLFLYNFVTGTETQLTHSDGDDLLPRFSPDGTRIAFVRNGEGLYVLDLSSGRTRRVAKADITLDHPLEASQPFAWSPQGRWLAFPAWGDRMFRNAWVVPAAGGEARAVSFLGNTFAGSIGWTPNGKALVFNTGQRTKLGQVARVDLVPRTPTFHREEFLDLFSEPVPPDVPVPTPAPSWSDSSGTQATDPGRATPEEHEEPVQIEFQNIASRLSLLPVGLNVQSVTIGPHGDKLLLTAEVAGRTNLYLYAIDPLADEPAIARQLTSSAGWKEDVQFSPDGETVFYLENGAIYSIGIEEAQPQRHAVRATLDVRFAREKWVVFHQAWRWLRDNFHDADMHGANWQAVREKYAPLVAGARTEAALYRLLNRMVGELNASHLGVRGPDGSEWITGRVGLRFDTEAYETRGVFRIVEVVPRSPTAVTSRIHAGDYLLAVGGVPLDAGTNVYRLLAHRIGKQTTLTVAATADGEDRRTIEVKPISSPAMAHLNYEAWVEHNRTLVTQWSDGRLGYVHLADMSLASLKRFYKSLNAKNATRQGVVIDIRNNFGGFVNAYALDALARRPYLTMTFRGMEPAAARTVLGQRALLRPTVLITNRVTLSDGEDFTQGYRALGLGKVVGEPTAGWIIYTSNVELIDGATVRLPFITVTTAKGQPMEMHPRPVDVPVPAPLGQSYRGRDARLKAAVETLLDQLQEDGATE